MSGKRANVEGRFFLHTCQCTIPIWSLLRGIALASSGLWDHFSTHSWRFNGRHRCSDLCFSLKSFDAFLMCMGGSPKLRVLCEKVKGGHPRRFLNLAIWDIYELLGRAKCTEHRLLCEVRSSCLIPYIYASLEGNQFVLRKIEYALLLCPRRVHIQRK